MQLPCYASFSIVEMPSYRSVVRVVIVFVIAFSVVPSYGQSSAWQSFRPGRSTPTEVLELFGSPDHVEIELKWREFVNFQAAPRRVTGYSMKYSPLPPRGELSILVGPLGRASSAFVYVDDGRARYIEWDYCCIYSAPAVQKLLADEAFQVKLTGKLMIGTKTISHGELYVTFSSDESARCTGDVTVLFVAPPNN